VSTFRHLTAADQAEKAIEDSIASGKWGEFLPSYRRLSEWMGLSCPTVALAVAKLVKRGLLVSPGKRQRFRIATKSSRQSSTKPRRHLLAIFPKVNGTADEDQKRIIAEAVRRATKDGWVCTDVGADYTDAGSVKKRWDHLLEHRPTHLLAAPGTKHLATWAHRNGLSAAFIGGQAVPAEHGITIGVKMADILSDCATRLHRLGHNRILAPYWGEMPGIAGFSAGILAKACQTRSDRLLAEGWVTQWQPGTPKEQREQLARSMAKLRPTAIICVLGRDYLLAMQCAEAAGLKIPRDLSLVTLSPSPDMDWLLPAPSYYKVDTSTLIDAADLWRHGKLKTDKYMTQAVLNSWNPGESIGPAPV